MNQLEERGQRFLVLLFIIKRIKFKSEFKWVYNVLIESIFRFIGKSVF